jgi:hypothetical protein
MKIDHAIETLVVSLQFYEINDGAEIVAEMQIAGRLNA